MSAPSFDFARFRPLYAASLNERSLRPPMSVTRPIFTFLAPESPPPLDAEDDDDDEPALSSLPQAASPRHSASSTAMSRTPFPFTFPNPLTTAWNPLPEWLQRSGRLGGSTPEIRMSRALLSSSGTNAARTAVVVSSVSAASSSPHSRAATASSPPMLVPQ